MAEAEFGDGEASPSDVPDQIAGSPDDRCFQRDVELYPSGHVESYKFEIDLDDGLDIDEAGDGDLRVVMIKGAIRGNLDEGVDFDEEDSGTAAVTLIDTTADGNRDDGVRVSESGAGDVDGLAFGIVAENNGGNGIRLEEADAGTLRARVANTKTANNDDGKDAGLRMSQTGEGTGTLALRNSRTDDGIDVKNVSVVEE